MGERDRVLNGSVPRAADRGSQMDPAGGRTPRAGAGPAGQSGVALARSAPCWRLLPDADDDEGEHDQDEPHGSGGEDQRGGHQRSAPLLIVRSMNEAAKIHTGASYDFMAPDLPPGMTRQAAAAWIREDPQAADKVFRDLMSASTGTRRAVQNGMFTFACPSPAAWFPAAPDYALAGVS